MQAFKFNFQLSNCQLFNQWDFVDLKVANQKARKATDSVRIILTKIHLSFLRKVNGVFSPHLFSAFDHFGVLLLQKNKLTSVFYVSVLLLMINFVIAMSKFTAEPLAWGYKPLWQSYDAIYLQWEDRCIKSWRQFVFTITRPQSGQMP